MTRTADIGIFRPDASPMAGRVAFPDTSGETKGSIVCVHGGPGSALADHAPGKNGHAYAFSQLESRAADAGLACLRFDMTGCALTEGKPEDVSLDTWRRDLDAALDYARDNLPGPLILVAESMGATVAAWSGWPEKASALAFVNPAFDLAQSDLARFLADEDVEREMAEKGFSADGNAVVGRDLYRELTETCFERFFDLPEKACLIVHGKHDADVNFEQALKAVERAKGPVTLAAHPTAGHGFQFEGEREFLLDTLANWLERQVAP